MVDIFRSVGETQTDLNTGAATMSIVADVLTASAALLDKVGIGDAITFNDGSDRLAFIHARAGPTSFTVKDKDGGTAPTASAGQAFGIFRCYEGLLEWEREVENANITEPTENDVNPPLDLDTNNIQLRVACYADGVDVHLDAGGFDLDINGRTTSATDFIDIFTPVTASQVGVSQRHAGKFSSSVGYLKQSDTFNATIGITDAHVRITGLQIENTRTTGTGEAHCIESSVTTSGAEQRILKNILKKTGDNTTAGTRCYLHNPGGGSNRTIIIANNIAHGDAPTLYQFSSEADDVFIIYNNTGIGTPGTTLTGFHLSMFGATDTFRLKNNLAKGTDTQDFLFGSSGTTEDFLNNASEDATADDGGGSNHRINQTFTFVNEGADDFHLAAGDAGAKDFGVDLSADSAFAVTDDIDGDSRPQGSAYDIGADEAVAALVLESIERHYPRGVERGVTRGVA